MHDYKSEHLKIFSLADNVFQHISYLQTETFGKVACNGLVYIDSGEAIVFDSPATERVSKELIDWVEQNLKTKIIAVVPTHFHEDCLGGLDEFHRRSIPSYSLNKTIRFASEQGYAIPQNGFDSAIELTVGTKSIQVAHFGEGHTKDNVVGFMPSEQVLFGGCLVKRVGAGKGNLADANVFEWSHTVEKVKAQFPDVQIVVPGHGSSGGKELLDFTIELFKEG